MMVPAPLIVWSLLLVGAESHERANPVFAEMISSGVGIGAERVPLAAPSFPDGLDAAAQAKALADVAGQDYDPAQLSRKSVVAPFVLRMDKVKDIAPGVALRKIDTWFVAYGDLKTVAQPEFRKKVWSSQSEEDRGSSQGREVTAADLAKRGIELATSAAKPESFGWGTNTIFNKVELAVAGRSFTSETPESFVVASVVDRRFDGDAEFPNQWQALIRGESGAITKGPPQPYEGAAFYLKVTKLHEPAGAIMVESHLIFAEPEKWFSGANLIASKVPLIANAQVRAFRRELLKADSK